MMTLAIRYLTGRCVAARFEDSSQAEWPPHPARVFMALAAAYFDRGEDAQERAALEWLEVQPPPEIQASGGFERVGQTPYVPVNDDHGGIAKRTKMDRAFPSTRLDSEMVYLRFAGEPTREVRDALERLAFQVTRIGHSASLVQLSLYDGTGFEANWRPSKTGAERLRVTKTGYLRYLKSVYNGDELKEYFRLSDEIEASKGGAQKKLKAQLKERFPAPPLSERPAIAHWQAYEHGREQSDASDEIVQTVFDPNFYVLAPEADAPGLDLEASLQVTKAARGMLLRYAEQPNPGWLSGHNADGSPCQYPHVAVFPMPFVDARFADGHIMGIGVAVPRELEDERERHAALREVLGPVFLDAGGEEKEREIGVQGRWGWKVRRNDGNGASVTLRRETWTRPSHEWFSVTPVVLHHYPDRGDPEDLARIVIETIRSAQLPEPERLEIGPDPFAPGVRHARNMPPFLEGGEKLCRYQTHVRIRWARKIEGPILIGRGRYRGYGLLRPARERGQGE